MKYMNIVRIIGILSLTTIGVMAGLTSASCSSGGDKPQPTPYDDPCDYVGEADGSNWKGDESDGTCELGIEYINGYAMIWGSSISSDKYDLERYTIDVPKKNLVIPKYIKKLDEHDQILSIKGLDALSFYNRSLAGSLFIPNTINTVGRHAFDLSSNFLERLVFNYSSIPLYYDDLAFADTNSPGTIKNCDPNLTSQALVDFLHTKGLPDNWTAATD